MTQAVSMVGVFSEHTGTFLQVTGILAALFALPMLISPLAWAKALGWERPVDTHLALYFGRCLGGVVTVMAVFAFVASYYPEVQAFYIAFVLAAVLVNIGVHLYGAIRRIQPVSETIEIAAWVTLFICGLLFFP